MPKYNHNQIEKKWQKKWAAEKDFEVPDDAAQKKYYCLIEFPYPSGQGLHVGHIRSNTAMDIIARKRRAEGYSVLYPIGWDAFGLPTENYALKTGIPPQKVTKQNTDNFRKQLKRLGFSFDWSREINTTDPAYYKWTQWIFLKLFEHGLAYKKKMPINWCIDCKTGLANEEVIDGVCERCGGAVEMREKEQWMLKITEYADRLDKDLDTVDYPEKIKIQQRNWIGRSDGAEIEFQLRHSQKNAEQTQNDAEKKLRNSEVLTSVKVFTTRADTLFGATYLAISPEIANSKFKNQNAKSQFKIENWNEVDDYIRRALAKKDIDRVTETGEKTGVELKGIKAINPANGEEISVWVADYVLGGYGTGAIMAVPAHDERDHSFAKKFNLPIVEVIYGEHTDGAPYCGEGTLVNSGEFDGLSTEEAKEKIIARVGGKKKVTYKLRDWVFSRQRYWGEPIPLVFCAECKKRAETIDKKQLNVGVNGQRSIVKGFNFGEITNPGWVAVPEDNLPVELPKVKSYAPTDTGESPLAAISKWVNTKCPKCGGAARRETDTMPNWAGSSWYYLRYCDPHNNKELASMEKLKYWLTARPVGGSEGSQRLASNGVDWYNGGMEHTTLHLLYSRFWHKFLFDIGTVPTVEPYAKRTSHGLILAESGEKMSKSKGNVVNPDSIVEIVGADSLRLYEMFMGPFSEPIAWNTNNIAGVRRFIERLYACMFQATDTELSKSIEILMHQTIKKVGDDIEAMKFNTAVSQMMIFLNALEKENTVSLRAYRTLVRLSAPFIPHVTEEIGEHLGEKNSVHKMPWPQYDETKITGDMMIIVVQVNGKVRGQFQILRSESEESVKEKAQALDSVTKWVQGKYIQKVIYIAGKLVNIVAD